MKPRVLLIDDDSSILDSLRRALRKEPYEICTAASGSQALELVKSISIDVVVSDQEMPGMSGTELLTILREHHPSTLAIMLTGKPSLAVAQQALNQGEIYRFLTKPCDTVQLAHAIREGLKQRALIIQCRRMIDTMRLQRRYIEALERENPGIMHVERDSRGALTASVNVSLDEALREATAELERSEPMTLIKTTLK